jgi:hypothetical protein
MRKREIFWVVVLLLTAWAYVHFFTTLGVKREIMIIPSLRPLGGGGRAGNRPVFPVLFQLDDYYKLTSLRAVEVETNNVKAPEHEVWHLVSADGSEPVKVFLYGQNIQGMTPYLPGVGAESLITNVPYRLEVTAGKRKGSTPFHTTVMP